MRDGFLRTAIKRVALWRFMADLHATRRIRRMRGEIPYRLGGQCQCCAKCCEEPTIQVNWWTFRFRTFRWLFLAWQRKVNGFELVGEHPASRTFSFRCTHFDWETRKCDSYHSRPGMCRDYPRLHLWQSQPELFPECGYKAIAWNAERLEAMLEDEDLPAEKLEELKRKMHLK